MDVITPVKSHFHAMDDIFKVPSDILTAIELIPGGSSTVNIYTQTQHRSERT